VRDDRAITGSEDNNDRIETGTRPPSLGVAVQTDTNGDRL